MKDLLEKVKMYASENPVKFAALSSFSTLGAIPLLAFLAYTVATLVASVIGAVVIELFLLAMGIMALAFVLFFVTCISVCVTSVFASVYFSYKAVTSAVFKSRDIRFPTSAWPWPFSSTEHSEPHQSDDIKQK